MSSEERPTNQELIDELQYLAEKLEKTPSTSDMEQLGNYSRYYYYDRFGSWRNASEAAGLEPNTRGRHRVSEKELLGELRRLADAIGKVPSASDMNDLGEYSHTVYIYRFGNWNEAIEAIGLSPNSPGRPRTSKSELSGEVDSS